MKILFYTLGCRVNQAETGGMGALLQAHGHQILVEGEAIPDAVIINTCTVTASADRKSRTAIRRMRKQYPNAILGVCGCLSQLESPGTIADIDIIGGSGQKSAFIRELERLAAGHTAADNAGTGISVSDAPAADKQGTGTPAPPDLLAFPADFDRLPAAPPEGRTRVFLKIQDGCENHCTYCRIPAARGPSRSLPEERVLEAARNAAHTAPELVLCGIEISSYHPSLTALTERVCAALPDTRIRLGSLDPRTPDGDFCRTLAAFPNFCPHFHLSLQSCSDSVLARMGRRYGLTGIAAVFANLRRHWENPAITCDILTGFPGESPAEYEETLAALRRLAPAGLHVFPYSRRKDTPAAELPGQLTAAQKAERAKGLLQLGESLRAGYLDSLCGTLSDVLYETEKDGLWLGHTPEYMPVYTPSVRDLRGVTAKTRLVEKRADEVFGEIE